MKIRTLTGRCVAAIALSMTLTADVAAQEPATPAAPATPTETERLQADVERLKAEQARFEAKFGTLADGLAPKGDTTATGLVVEGEILAYSTVDSIAAKIATDVKAANPTKIVIFSDAELKLMTELGAVESQIKRLKQLRDGNLVVAPADKCAKPGDVQPMNDVPIAGIANVAVAAFSLFRVDREITGTKVELNDFAVSAQVAKGLITKGLKVVYLPSVYNLAAQKSADDIAVIVNLGALRDEVKRDIGKTDVDRKKLESCAKQFTKFFEDSAKVQENRKQLLTVIEATIESITKPDEAGVSRLQAYMRASQMRELTKDAWLLQIEPVTASGNVLKTKNLFYSKLRFGGGSVIAYMLFEPSGLLATSGTVGGYVGGKKMSEVPSVVGALPAADPKSNADSKSGKK